MSEATSGGAFVPTSPITITGQTEFTILPIIGTSTLLSTTASQILTNKTLTSPILNSPTTTAHVGNVPISVGAIFPGTAVAIEYGDGVLHQTQITFVNVPLTVTLATTGVGQLLYAFPQGVITILGASGNMTEKTTSILANTLNASVTYNWGVGTVTQSTGALATTQQDVIPTTNGTASATINVAGAVSLAARTAAPAQFNGNATSINCYFNVGVAGAGDIDADATTIWNGVMTITWLFNGLAA